MTSSFVHWMPAFILRRLAVCRAAAALQPTISKSDRLLGLLCSQARGH